MGSHRKKMCNNFGILPTYGTIFIIYHFCIIIIYKEVNSMSTAEPAAHNEDYCSPAGHDTIKNWIINNNDASSQLPANITMIPIESNLGEENYIAIELWANERREDFELMLFANPFATEKSDCKAFNETEEEKLRHFIYTCNFYKDNDENISTLFGRIFTGCYYFLMKNKDEQYWQFGPVFYNTGYCYLNTKLGLLAKPSFNPESPESTMKLIISIKVPLECMEVRAQLYQLQGNVEGSINDIRNNSIPESQKCWFEMIDKKVKKTCEYSSIFTDLQLIVDVGGYDISMAGGWTAEVTWDKLQPGGGIYYFRFTGYTHRKCNSTHIYPNLNTWLPIEGDILVSLGRMNLTNVPDVTTISEDFSWLLTTCGLITVAITLILFYWIKKYHSLLCNKDSREETAVEKRASITLLDNIKESSEILLIYGKGSSLLMNQIDKLKQYLAENCSNYCVHDMYATNEWNRVCQLGVAGWIQEMLKHGSKIVWVDTPEFRSCLNDKWKQYNASDFRAAAIPYAIAIAMDSYQNPATQYRHHFVVRVKGCKVEDEDDDPLQVVTPHARYYIPDQLPLLCEHLKGLSNEKGEFSPRE